MILVDSRIGSRDLVEPLKKQGVVAELAVLAYGDVSWIGNGPDGPIPVGVEIKAIGDLLSCITTERFSGHQLGGLQDSYQVWWLLVEGIWRPGPDGELLISHHGGWSRVPWGRKQWLYRQVDHWLTTMELRAGARIKRTGSRAETVRVIHNLYTWWTADEWEDHRSHLAFDNPLAQRVSLLRPSQMRKTMATLPGIGWERSAAVEAEFKTIRKAVNADQEAWQKIPGIGPKVAAGVRRAIG